MELCNERESNIKQGETNADQLLQAALREALEPKKQKSTNFHDNI